MTPNAWTTAAELHYLDDLGDRFRAEQNLPEREGYARYLAAARRRRRWGDLDRSAVLAHAERHLLEATLALELEVGL